MNIKCCGSSVCIEMGVHIIAACMAAYEEGPAPKCLERDPWVVAVGRFSRVKLPLIR